VCEAIANSQLTTLAIVHDINESLARESSERYQIPFTTSLEELLRADIDAVYIAVPHYLLAALAKQALLAGKHTLVEKPLALSLADIDELIALAEKNSLTLGVFYQMRYAASFQQARELVRAGALGEVFGVKIQVLIHKHLTYWEVGYSGRSANPWRGLRDKAGGGVTLMNCSHLLDGLWYVTGMNVTQVTAEKGTLVSKVQVEDTLAATLRFDNNAIGSLFVGAHILGAEADETFEVYGTRGTLRVPDPYSEKPLQIFLCAPHGDFSADTWHTIPRPQVNVFARATQEFARAVQAKRPAPVNGYDARRVLEIVLGMYRAAEERHIVTVGAET
jgi:predicted dehydrogenase